MNIWGVSTEKAHFVQQAGSVCKYPGNPDPGILGYEKFSKSWDFPVFPDLDGKRENGKIGQKSRNPGISGSQLQTLQAGF